MIRTLSVCVTGRRFGSQGRERTTSWMLLHSFGVLFAKCGPRFAGWVLFSLRSPLALGPPVRDVLTGIRFPDRMLLCVCILVPAS